MGKTYFGTEYRTFLTGRCPLFWWPSRRFLYLLSFPGVLRNEETSNIVIIFDRHHLATLKYAKKTNKDLQLLITNVAQLHRLLNVLFNTAHLFSRRKDNTKNYQNKQFKEVSKFMFISAILTGGVICEVSEFSRQCSFRLCNIIDF